ncbi:MAG: hypothetical protein EOP06_03715 [Proteobacteria bacterium]|nr:MAG: hypothetical protein EOP06_03715 [Pseudomonadota bacterium]
MPAMLLKQGANTYAFATGITAASTTLIYTAVEAPIPTPMKLLLGGLGITVLITNQTPVPPPTTLKNTYAEWKKSVEKTLSEQGTYVYPPGLANTVAIQADGSENLDAVWQSCGMRIVRRQYFTDRFQKYDSYDQNGFAGFGYLNASIPGIFEDRGEYVQNWQQVDP